MIKIYTMDTCPECKEVKRMTEGNGNYEIIDIGSHVKLLKEFLNLRDTREEFEQARQKGSVGIPCFVMEDGSIVLDTEKAGLKVGNDNAVQGKACNIDGSGC